MGKLIKFAIVAVVLYATWQAAVVQWHHFRFEDAVKQIAEFGPDKEEDVIKAQVLEAGRREELGLDPDHVGVRKNGDHVFIDVTYTHVVRLLPGYTYPWAFSVKAEGYFIQGGRIRK